MAEENKSRNLWPMGIVAAFVVFIAGTIFLIVLSTSSKPDLVERDYYEQEVRFQGQMDRVERTRRLQPPPTVAFDLAQQHIKISLPTDHASRAASGRIHLYRPSERGMDRQLELRLDANGVQKLETKGMQPGLWKVRISWKVEGQEYYLDQSVIVG